MTSEATIDAASILERVKSANLTDVPRAIALETADSWFWLLTGSFVTEDAKRDRADLFIDTIVLAASGEPCCRHLAQLATRDDMAALVAVGNEYVIRVDRLALDVFNLRPEEMTKAAAVALAVAVEQLGRRPEALPVRWRGRPAILVAAGEVDADVS
jgi:hypothetical protein